MIFISQMQSRGSGYTQTRYYMVMLTYTYNTMTWNSNIISMDMLPEIRCSSLVYTLKIIIVRIIIYRYTQLGYINYLKKNNEVSLVVITKIKITI